MDEFVVPKASISNFAELQEDKTDVSSYTQIKCSNYN